MEIIGRFGTDEQRETYLLPLLQGATRSCFGKLYHCPVLSCPVHPCSYLSCPAVSLPALHCTVLCCTVLHCTDLYHTLCCIVLSCTVLFLSHCACLSPLSLSDCDVREPSTHSHSHMASTGFYLFCSVMSCAMQIILIQASHGRRFRCTSLLYNCVSIAHLPICHHVYSND